MLEKGIKSIAVVLKHSAIYPDHEEAVGKLAKEMGFEQVQHMLLLIPLLITPSLTMLGDTISHLHLFVNALAACDMQSPHNTCRSACHQR